VAFSILYHPDVRDDLFRINEKLKKRIKTAIEARIAVAPEQYGAPLRKNLKGYWKVRVGDYRIVYKVKKNEVLILAVIHRKNVYEKSLRRKP